MRPQQTYIILNRNGSINCSTSDWEIANQIIADGELNGNYDMTVYQCNHYTHYVPIDCTDQFIKAI
jgi:hypothetical protein